MKISFSRARKDYESRAELRSAHTLGAYRRAIDLFLMYLDDAEFPDKLPLQQREAPNAAECLLEWLCQEDEPVLCYFARWMQMPASHEGDRRPYALSTVELRLAGVQRWFEFMQAEQWLPEDFSLEQAVTLFKRYLSENRSDQPAAPPAVQVPQDLSGLLSFYEHQKAPRRLNPNTEQFQRWDLTRLRNNALIRTLAETGGQISTILSINVHAIAQTDGRDQVVVDLVGKNSHRYKIYLQEALPAIRHYLKKRAVPQSQWEQMPVFVSHDARYDGQRMSRIIAWRIIQRAAKHSGIETLSPHDLRHWCAKRLIENGASLEEVKERLGHRSMHTVRDYYGHLIEQ